MSQFDDLRFEQDTEEDSVFKSNSNEYGKQIKAVPKPEVEIGIDRNDIFISNIINQGKSSQLDISKINSFTSISADRNSVYDLIDTMSEDPMVASALEIYTEDVTETNENGEIVWCESDNADIQKYVTFLLDSMNIDKNIYEWAQSFIKYGDLYLRLYRKSDFEKANIFKNENATNDRKFLNEEVDKNKSEKLNEDVILKIYHDTDPYMHYVEMIPNPAEMFELTKFGKTFAYIQADTPTMTKKDSGYLNATYKYSFKAGDVDIYQPTSFVHACLKDNTTRSPEEVELFTDESSNDPTASPNTFSVKRGQSILYNVFKIWREMTLLENSMLLNRLTKSSIIRLLNVEVGDMPKEEIGPHLTGIKRLFEQKTAINTGNSLEEYTNPGPIENYVYVPTHNGQGTITSQEMGGDTSVTGLDDVDYFKNKMFGSLKIPGQYLGFTDDNTGFNGGTSLTIVSSRYAKTIKRIQNQLIQAFTDLINLMLIDKHLDNYVNKFKLRMQQPTTQEEIDRKESRSTSIGNVQDILSLLDVMQKESSKLKALKALLPQVTSDAEIMNLIEQEIELAELEESGDVEDKDFGAEDFDDDANVDLDFGGSMHTAGGNGLDDLDFGDESNTEEPSGETTLDELPTPDDLGAGDFTDNNIEI